MGDEEHGSGPRDGTDGADHGPEHERRGKLRWRPGVWLTTLSTVVAVATGMFTLRDQIFPSEAGRAQADPTAYEYGVGQICTGINGDQRALVTDDKRLAQRLAHATTPTAETDAIRDAWTAVTRRSEHELAIFEGLPIPSAVSGRHHAVQKAWTAMNAGEEAFVQSLNAALTVAALDRALAGLPALRTQIERADVMIGSGLRYLGSLHCTLAQPAELPAVPLPQRHARAGKGGAARRPGPGGQGTSHGVTPAAPGEGNHNSDGENSAVIAPNVAPAPPVTSHGPTYTLHGSSSTSSTTTTTTTRTTTTAPPASTTSTTTTTSSPTVTSSTTTTTTTTTMS